MDTAYKIYANILNDILNDRLGKEVKEKLKEVQFGFRKGRGTTDAMYIMNYIVNKELCRKGGQIFAFFVDLRAMFDNVDRRLLNEIMKKIKVST